MVAWHGEGGVKYVDLLANKVRHTSYGPERKERGRSEEVAEEGLM